MHRPEMASEEENVKNESTSYKDKNVIIFKSREEIDAWKRGENDDEFGRTETVYIKWKYV